jgi:hypothetical protein
MDPHHIFLKNDHWSFNGTKKDRALLHNVPTEYLKYYHATLYYIYCPKKLRSLYEKPAGNCHDSKKDVMGGAISFEKAFSSSNFLREALKNLECSNLFEVWMLRKKGLSSIHWIWCYLVALVLGTRAAPAWAAVAWTSQRPYAMLKAPVPSITVVKQHWAQSVLGWVTAYKRVNHTKDWLALLLARCWSHREEGIKKHTPSAWRVALWDPSVGSGPNSAGSVWPAGNNGHASLRDAWKQTNKQLLEPKQVATQVVQLPASNFKYFTTL